MPKNNRIIIADDHPLLLRGLTEELIANNYKVIHTAQDGEKALELILKHEPDIAILDIQMPILTGFEVIKACENKTINTKFIVLTSHKENRYVLKAKNLNISGYLLKDEPFIEIENCIQAINNGKTYFSSIFNNVYEKEVSPELDKLQNLSPSELKIMQLIAQNKSTKDMAETLFISVRTVQKHRTNIIAKLKLEANSDALTAWAKTYKEFLFKN
jgi:DNA-binding NarL/FixJ family response regulator